MRELNNGSRNAFARHLASARRWITSCVDRYNAAADYAALSDLSDAELRQRSLSRSSLAHDLTSVAPSQKEAKVGKADRALFNNPLENAKHERNLRTWPLRLSRHVRDFYSDVLGLCIQPASSSAVDDCLRHVSTNRRPLRGPGAMATMLVIKCPATDEEVPIGILLDVRSIDCLPAETVQVALSGLWGQT